MSRNAVMMSGQVKLEVQSPVKLDVLKPSNAANIQNRTSGVSSKGVKESNIGRTALNRSAINKITSRTNSLRSSPPSSKSPHKALTPIRPSPNVKFSSRSPASSPYVRTPTSMTRLSSASSGGLGTPSPGKCRRRISYSDGGDLPVPVSRRNARERNRVKMVSQGFAILRQHVPHAARKKKLSKVETLRCAVEYIRGLQLLLDNHPPAVTQPHHIHPHHLQGMLPLSSTSSTSSSSTTSSTSASSSSAGHYHHQQLPPQVFLHPHHQGIEPHILKLPTAEDTYQGLGQMRYDGPDGAFLRTSPCNSSDISPTSSFYEQKFTPPGSTAEPPGTNTSPTSTTSSSSSTSPSSLPLGVIKTEGNEEIRNYGREEQDLLEALAWWQHNIN
ncbi:uncharacterized protein [Palaemon carinicauda]|uniref:uncharacterized protein n=1 Tax=Palaemon carinicauda TaxID=392227 RepID=UPI0035B5F87F